jgi:repressor LexA
MLLPPDEQRLLDCLRLYINCQGYSPTIRELKKLLGEPSTSVIQNLLDCLRRRGLITWAPGKGRTIQLVGGNLVLRGIVEAGFLLEHPEDEQQLVSLPGRYGPNDYALRVRGDSMIEAQICDGDLVVVRPEHDLWSIRPGQIAVVWIEGEGATLKHIYYQEGEEAVILKSANRRYQSRTLDRSRVGLQGVLLKVYRDYDQASFLEA